jgi:hypothetical protein
MLENWVFMAGAMAGGLYGLFYGCMLLIAPYRCPTMYGWTRPSVILARKRPLMLTERFLGLCFSSMMLLFLWHVIPRILHPTRVRLSTGQSPFPSGRAQWDMLALGLFGLVSGYFLLARSAKSVEMLFWSDTSRLKDNTTLRLWTFATRTFALAIVCLSLVFVTDFIRSLRH